MLNLVKILSYSSNPTVSVAASGFPEKLWCRKSFSKEREENYIKTRLYGCVVKELILANSNSDIIDFLNEAYANPQHVTIYSHVDDLYSMSRFEHRGIGMHLSGDFFKKDSKYKTNLMFFDMDSIPVDFDVTDIKLCGEFLAHKLFEFNRDYFSS